MVRDNHRGLRRENAWTRASNPDFRRRPIARSTPSFFHPHRTRGETCPSRPPIHSIPFSSHRAVSAPSGGIFRASDIPIVFSTLTMHMSLTTAIRVPRGQPMKSISDRFSIAPLLCRLACNAVCNVWKRITASV